MRSQVPTMKLRTYPQNLLPLLYLLLLYLLLLYSSTYYTYWCTHRCIYVPTVPTTVPTARARAIPTAVQYVVRTDIRTYCTADVRTYTYIYIYICCGRVDRYLLHLLSVRTYCTYVRTACIYWWCMYLYWRKTACRCKHVLVTAVRTYLLLLPGTRVPTAVCTYPPYVLL